MGNGSWVWIAIIAVVAYFVFVGGNPFATNTPSTQPSEDTPVTGCAIEDVSFTPKMTRLGKAGTALTGASENYFILTDSLGSTNGGTSTTLPVNYDVEVMFGEASTTYYTVVKTINTDCKDPFYEPVSLALADTSLNSFYAKNSDGSVNSATVTQGMGASEDFETTVTIKAGSDTYFGNPDSECSNVGVVQYDKTYIQSVEGNDPVAIPGFYGYHNSSYDGAAAFIIPKVGDGQEATFNVKFTSTTTEPDGSAYPILSLYDCDIDKNEDTLELIEGVEDEDLNELSLAAQNLTIYID